MPAHPLAGHADAETEQPGIVLVRLLDMLGRGDHVDAHAVLVAMRGRLEAGLPERGEPRRVFFQRHYRALTDYLDRGDCQRMSHLPQPDGHEQQSCLIAAGHRSELKGSRLPALVGTPRLPMSRAPRVLNPPSPSRPPRGPDIWPGGQDSSRPRGPAA